MIEAACTVAGDKVYSVTSPRASSLDPVGTGIYNLKAVVQPPVRFFFLGDGDADETFSKQLPFHPIR